MKKKLYLAFVLLLALVCLFCSCDGTSDTTTGTESPKNEDHIHAYTIKNVDDAYLKESTADGVLAYYYSCACGEKGTETFTLPVGGGNNQGSDKEEHVYETTWTADEEKHWRACMDASCSATSDEALHTFGEWTVDKAPTCTSTGTRHHVCTVCNKSVSETMPVEPTAHNYATTWTSDGTHHWHMCLNGGCTSVLDKAPHSVVNGKCAGCGAGTYTRDGDYIYFGEYPQTIKADDVTITSTTDSRGYYLGSDGAYYAKVTAKPYFSGYTFSTGKTVSRGTVYYFKVEPIRWRILSENGDTALILCDSIIANHRFDDSNNNYANSEIRAWLNAEFYNTAFNGLQRELILITTVDNSVASTGYLSNSYACADTNDKIFLLSYEEVTNTAYGFSSSYSNNDTARRMQTTDYTRATGAYMSTSSSYYGNGHWWLRSPYFDYDYYAREVYYDGLVGNNDVDRGYGGVVPALQIRLK